MELSYFTFVFLVVRPFVWYQGEGHLFGSRSNIKVTYLKKIGHCRGHSYFTNASSFFIKTEKSVIFFSYQSIYFFEDKIKN